jgi:hypothetical protein
MSFMQTGIAARLFPSMPLKLGKDRIARGACGEREECARAADQRALGQASARLRMLQSLVTHQACRDESVSGHAAVDDQSLEPNGHQDEPQGGRLNFIAL